jgi:hypothetical protein
MAAGFCKIDMVTFENEFRYVTQKEQS